MKKLIFTFFVLIGISSFGFAQEANQIAATKGAKELSASKESGTFEFTLPDNVTADEVEKNATYYTHYFSVTFDASSDKASIKTIDNYSDQIQTNQFLDHLNVDNHVK